MSNQKKRLKMSEEQLNALTLKEGLNRALLETKFNLLKKVLLIGVVMFFIQLLTTVISRLCRSVFILSSLFTLIGGLSLFVEMAVLGILLLAYSMRTVQNSNLIRLNDAGLGFMNRLAHIMSKESKSALRCLIGIVGILFILSVLILIVL